MNKLFRVLCSTRERGDLVELSRTTECGVYGIVLTSHEVPAFAIQRMNNTFVGRGLGEGLQMCTELFQCPFQNHWSFVFTVFIRSDFLIYL